MNEYMDVAIDLSDDNFDKAYGGPFGACVVKDGKIIGKGINRVIVILRYYDLLKCGIMN